MLRGKRLTTVADGQQSLRILSPGAQYPASRTFMCNLIEDLALLANAQLPNQQSTYKQLVRLSKSAAPTFRSVRLVATLDVACIHGCPHSAAPSVGIGSLKIIRSPHLCTWSTSGTLCSRQGQPDTRNNYTCIVIAGVFKLKTKPAFFFFPHKLDQQFRHI